VPNLKNSIIIEHKTLHTIIIISDAMIEIIVYPEEDERDRFEQENLICFNFNFCLLYPIFF